MPETNQIRTIKRNWLTVDQQIDEGLRDPETRFDESLYISSEKLTSILARLPFIVEGQRRRTALHADQYRRTTILVIANALAAHSDGVPCYYRRGTSVYRGGGLYHPEWLSSPILLEVIDGMETLGLLECVRATANRGGETPCSTFKARESLLAWLREAGILPCDVAYDPRAVCPLILKAPKDGRGQKKPVAFDPAAPAQAQAIQGMHRINEFLAAQTLEEVREDGSRHRPAWRPLRRIFNNGRWDHSGRHYGGWWQNRSKKQRKRILINGEETIILDFKGYMPRGLYHLQRIEYADDPYDIPKIREAAEEEGLEWSDVREGLKQLFQILTNSKRNGGGKYKVKGKNGRFVLRDLGLPESIGIKRAFRLMVEKHAPIKHRFYKQECFSMMHRESEIADSIINRGIENGIVVLSIFDAFVVEHRHQEWLERTMKEEYHKKFHFNPHISTE